MVYIVAVNQHILPGSSQANAKFATVLESIPDYLEMATVSAATDSHAVSAREANPADIVVIKPNLRNRRVLIYGTGEDRCSALAKICERTVLNQNVIS